MPKIEEVAAGTPCADEIRAALSHMAESDAFRGSPQLVCFLRYVVEATLRGGAERIKGYTIAVEALGRKEDFDPQTDPIVRVEAMRLRRALNRYYENGGSGDAVVIDLPLGSYVPTFRRNEVRPVAAKPVESAAARGWRSAPALTSIAASLFLGAALYAGLDFLLSHLDASSALPPEAVVTTSSTPIPARQPTPFPVVYVGGFDASGENGASPALAERLRGKLRDALARFDEIAIVDGPPPVAEGSAAGRRSKGYGLAASVDISLSGFIRVSLRLTDQSDERIAFARTFQQPQPESDGAVAEEAIVREIAIALAQPYGIIHARERAQHVGSAAGDPRYRCLIDSYDYWRTQDIAQHAHVRDCLEQVTSADPSFAAGYSALAETGLQEYRRGFTPRPGDAPPLERAFRAARRAVELRPGSARSHQVLMEVLFLRGEGALALEAGEKAVSLNPYNPNIVACYGARLIALGEVEKGARYIRSASAAAAVRPAWHDFYLFLAAYLTDDRRAAASYAGQFTSETFPPGLLARALVAAQKGKADVAREYFAKLANVQPGWREDPLRQAKKRFPADVVANRLASDVARISGSLGQ
jgi:tetratricopeptide (TPR) repeat protein